MEFKKFSSLENTYRQNLIDKVQYEGKDGGDWIVTEKIHGANFSFWCDGEVVKVASRSQFVDGTFYGCQSVIDRYSPLVLEYHQQRLPVGSTLVIFGELFGQGVQKEVEYGHKDFRAFDVVISDTVQRKDSAIACCEQIGIPFSPVIFTGSFKECMEICNTFQSLLTPDGYEGDNFAEGLVIEPVEPRWFNTGSRVYFKNKTPAFSEKKSKPKDKQVFDLSDSDCQVMDTLLEYNTPQRVANVLSKFGQVESKDFGKILGLMLQDMLEDFTKETELDAKSEVGDNWKQFLKVLNSKVQPVVREVFLKHID